ncbi:hypothetical protein F1188_08120 [Roseospira marina]|uniref:Uncharacterized protein n=1 Tax=Roseospira marina TaxID=140057 RepID=A0A5M6IEK5_9PROT|nr:hypothetical protein [Roseospira marina]KAA5605978.1 hypothetical protein F1188_08120 [Roseospira marina]MBB4313173.1 hypothetical protein [Roseospira marina]MBB5086086.1 hypothetical protein [Roseospira marina]
MIKSIVTGLVMLVALVFALYAGMALIGPETPPAQQAAEDADEAMDTVGESLGPMGEPLDAAADAAGRTVDRLGMSRPTMS